MHVWPHNRNYFTPLQMEKSTLTANQDFFLPVSTNKTFSLSFSTSFFLLCPKILIFLLLLPLSTSHLYRSNWLARPHPLASPWPASLLLTPPSPDHPRLLPLFLLSLGMTTTLETLLLQPDQELGPGRPDGCDDTRGRYKVVPSVVCSMCCLFGIIYCFFGG